MSYKKVMKLVIPIILVLLLVLSLCFNIFLLINAKDNGIFTSSDKLYSENDKKYLKLIEDILTKFKFQGYTEILKDKNYFLGIPEKATESDLLFRQKLFIYKNPNKKCIIFLAVTSSKYNKADNNEWTASYDYAPYIFNSNKGDHRASYNASYPRIQIASNGFNFDGCHISILSFSDDVYVNNQPTHLAGEELTSFSNIFLKFIYERKLKWMEK